MAVAVCANDHHPAVACTAPQLKSTLLVYKGAVVTLRNVTFAANKPSGHAICSRSAYPHCQPSTEKYLADAHYASHVVDSGHC